MSNIEGIFSLRIVTVDFYLEKPKLGLDPCFSEFRAKEIKKVPVIRIFGSSAEGTKTCMHVHGIFPYLYIPFDKKDFESLDKAIYLIASSIDKAINISLGQSSSASQHVFKIQLVKGIPFYGYHRNEHQYLKIYMLNPRFVKRAANLLQNGAIMGKIFHPHESHVPYILQFFIDFNLYGMSFLHVPMEVLKFRLKDENDVLTNTIPKEQILDSNIAVKQSTSKIELDIISGFILNRFQLKTKNTTHTNPGVESIWQDERVRRQELLKENNEVPPLEIPVSQERPHVKPTQSEEFYRTGLEVKLQQADFAIDQTMNSSLGSTIVSNESSKEKKRTFNLKKLIANAVYPEECSQDDILTNASFIADHVSDRSFMDASRKTPIQLITQDSDDVFLDETIVDEDLVRCLSQPETINQSLREEDMDLLDVMQQLEEEECENNIDLDSTLAPLSQNLDDSDTIPNSMVEQKSQHDTLEVESDNECLNDFTLVMDDMDELLLKLSQPTIPVMEQVDGADDVLFTPKKDTRKRLPTTPQTPITPKRLPKTSLGSPRTPKSVAKKYAPLPLLIQSRSIKKNLIETSKQPEAGCKDAITSVERNGLKKKSSEEKHKKEMFRRLETRRTSISTDVVRSGENTPISKWKRRQTMDLDRTHITCNLRPVQKTNELKLKYYNTEHEEVPQQNLQKSNQRNFLQDNNCLGVVKEKISLNLDRISPKVKLKKCSVMNKSLEVNSPQSPVTQQTMAKSCDSAEVHKIKSSFVCLEAPLLNQQSKITLPNTVKQHAATPDNNFTPSVALAEESSPKTHLKIKLKKCININSLSPKSPQIQTLKNVKVKVEKCSILENLSPRSSLTMLSENELTPDKMLNQCDKSKEINSSDRNGKKDLEIDIIKRPNCFAKRKSFSKRKHKLSLRLKNRTPKDQEQKYCHASLSIDEICDSSFSENESRKIKKKEDFAQPPTKKLRIKLKRFKKIEMLLSKQQNTSPTTPTKKTNVNCTSQNENTPLSGNMVLSYFKSPKFASICTPKRYEDEPFLDIEDDCNMQSFCENSFIVNSPVFTQMHVPSPEEIFQKNHDPSTTSVVITPQNLPETYEQVQENYKTLNIPDMIHQEPFYSDYNDVTHKKEVGHTVLCIPGKSLNDLENFQSTIPNICSFSNYRRKIVRPMNDRLQHDDRIREYLSTEKTVLITPLKHAPTKQDAKVWLKAKELLKAKEEKSVDNGDKELNIEEDSPIKIQRKKVVMLMETESGDADGDDNLDCSMQSLTLTPLTPLNSRRCPTPKTLDSLTRTPLTAPKGSGTKLKRLYTPKARVSLSKRLGKRYLTSALKKCTVEETASVDKSVELNGLLKLSGEDDLRSSRESLHSNETISSELALAELEKFSFVKNLHDSQGSFENSFGISHATSNNTYGFKVNLENLQQAKSDIEHNYLTTLSLEIFVSTRQDFLPNPEFDAIVCIFYAIENSIPSSCVEGLSKTSGFIIVLENGDGAKFNGVDSNVEIKVVSSELECLLELLKLCAHWDPDIFVGYEIEMSSWGYVIERAKYLNLNIAPLLSRIPSQKVRDFTDEDRDQLTDLDVETKLCGRILLDVWRLMRSEIALTSYTFENVLYHILHRRCPLHTHKDLSEWFKSPQTRWIVLEYYLARVRGTLELLDQLDLIGRTSEMAKLIGIQFYEVLSRGSQFRVESMMLRIAKPKNLVPLSPSVQQRAHMRAPEYLPLILEPQSRFYADPVIVLDFQSLYPSMIMAYNYCFSTCLGRVEHLGQSTPFEFGASQLRVSPTLLKKLLKNNMVTISPCGVVYVKREIREGILPRMLTEILDTRQMVKQSMKLHKTSTALQRILHSRQLGLKLIANVTYGYTAANFSGRMPCVEVGDSVVAKGRETLERAIKLVEANENWNVKVVYGDTDSLFVLVPGRSKDEAFRIGAEIAELVTQDNPQPVKLKLEKVYQPCILQTKKRYVGYMFESPDQDKPVYEAKGIETVRRDGCPAAVKMLEKTLRILFDSADVSQVKKYVCRQFTKLLSGRANIQDLIFAKEFRGLKGYRPTACVPALELTRKWIQIDPRKIPRRGERVPFIVTNGPPGLPLIRLVRSPHDVLADEGLKINAIYYITKAIIPPLNRCLLLIGADANEWFASLPRKVLFTSLLSATNETDASNAAKKSTISQYFSSTNCITDCGRQTKQGICIHCLADVSASLVVLEEKKAKLERGYYLTQFICQSCCGRPAFISCTSFDCPVLYVLKIKRRELNQTNYIQNIVNELI